MRGTPSLLLALGLCARDEVVSDHFARWVETAGEGTQRTLRAANLSRAMVSGIWWKARCGAGRGECVAEGLEGSEATCGSGEHSASQ